MHGHFHLRVFTYRFADAPSPEALTGPRLDALMFGRSMRSGGDIDPSQALSPGSVGEFLARASAGQFTISGDLEDWRGPGVVRGSFEQVREALYAMSDSPRGPGAVVESVDRSRCTMGRASISVARSISRVQNWLCR